MEYIEFPQRAGRAADARAAAALIYQADAPFYDYWFALTPELIQTNLALLWQAGTGAYSHTNHEVWTNKGNVIALASHYPAERHGQLATELAAQLDLLPLDATILHRRAAELAYLFAHIPHNAWYLRTLTVSADLRGHGLGGRILRDIVLMADAAGYNAVHADVDGGNPGAVKFYTRHGFEVIAETKVRALVDHDLPASLRMVRWLA